MGGLLAAAASSCLLAIQPFLVDLSLWLNASLMTVTFLLAARTILLMAVAFPFGIALAWIADSRENKTDLHLTRWCAPFAAGLGIATFVLGGMIGLIPLMTACVCLLAIAAGIFCARSSVWSISVRAAAGMGCLAVLALSLPMWRHCDDAARTAKLLFSTPTFIAYRSGWDVRQLPFLDDVRMIDRFESQSGPLTLWRGVAELYVREAGMPRAVVTKTLMPYRNLRLKSCKLFTRSFCATDRDAFFYWGSRPVFRWRPASIFPFARRSAWRVIRNWWRWFEVRSNVKRVSIH